MTTNSIGAAGAADRRAAFSTAAGHVIFGLVPSLALGLMLRLVFTSGDVAVDFHAAYWTAGNRLLNGVSPYLWNHQQIANGVAFVYPALSALLFAPFALIARGPSEIIFMSLCIVLVPVTLRVLEVRDWRIYGVAFLWLPIFGAWQTANLTMLLLAGTALAWHYRERPAVAGLVTALAISLKPFVWPLALWLLLTRRWRALAWSLGAGLVVNGVSWWVVGFGSITRYLHLSSSVTAALWRDGYGVPAIVARLGGSHHFGTIIEVIAAGLLVLAIARVGLRRRRGAVASGAAALVSDERALVLAIALMLVASPLVWSHYFALLLVPMAIRRPRLSPLWFAPGLMWVCPERTGIAGWELALAWAVATLCLFSLFRDPA